MISEKLKAVILCELGLEDYPIAPETVAPDVPGWDSLSHVRILSAVEKAFSIRFKTLEILRMKNVGDLQLVIDRKLNET